MVKLVEAPVTALMAPLLLVALEMAESNNCKAVGFTLGGLPSKMSEKLLQGASEETLLVRLELSCGEVWKARFRARELLSQLTRSLELFPNCTIWLPSAQKAYSRLGKRQFQTPILSCKIANNLISCK